MPNLLPISGVTPQQPAFLAPDATLVGEVTFGVDCSVWFGSVLRADINAIHVGNRVNIQDHCVLHVSRKLPCILDDEVSLGHRAVAHACHIGRGALLGIGCSVLDGAKVGEGALVGAGAVVTEGMEVPPHHLVAGVPAKIIKPLSPELQERIGRIAGDYVAHQAMYPSIMAQATDS